MKTQAPDILTRNQLMTVDEVIAQYPLLPAQKRLVVTLVNEQAWSIPFMAYFTAYGAAHSVCAKLSGG